MRGVWLRHTPAGADPARRPVPPEDSRWQHGDVVDALYLCGDEGGVWAEWYRDLAERSIPPQAALPRDLWSYEIALGAVADLRTSEGCAGVLAPSAAKPGSLILCVFLPDPTLPGAITRKHRRGVLTSRRSRRGGCAHSPIGRRRRRRRGRVRTRGWGWYPATTPLRGQGHRAGGDERHALVPLSSTQTR